MITGPRLPPIPTRIGDRLFAWGSRTFVMGIVNVTPDSFSGDGLLAPADDAVVVAVAGRQAADAVVAAAVAGRQADDAVVVAVALARLMVAAGVDVLDVGGESTRPGHARVAADEELRRVVPVVAAIHAALPATPISVDTTRAAVAAAALDAGAAMLNDVWGVAEDPALARLAAARGVPIVLMHNRAEARYADVVAEVVADLRAAVERAVRAGVPEAAILVDPGFGFGKTPVHNLAVLRDLGALRAIGRPILLGTSRKSTLGRILGLPVEERLEATLATTALAIGAGVDMVRVHDVGENVRAARVADAIVRGWAEPGDGAPGAGR